MWTGAAVGLLPRRRENMQRHKKEREITDEKDPKKRENELHVKASWKQATAESSESSAD